MRTLNRYNNINCFNSDCEAVFIYKYKLQMRRFSQMLLGRVEEGTGHECSRNVPWMVRVDKK